MDSGKGMLPISGLTPEELDPILEYRRRLAQQESDRMHRVDQVEQGVESLKRLWRILNGERPTRDPPHGMLPLAVPPARPKPGMLPAEIYPMPIIGVRG